MTPQHSYPPGRALPSGMTTQYLRMKCYTKHINAKCSKIFNTTNSGSRYHYLPAHRLVRYCFHCFKKCLTQYVHHLLKFSFPHRGKPRLCCSALYTLHPPGDPPWYKFTNYLNTKNRPFFNPSSWTIPMTWRSPERK
jgi:hypothetical protein